MTSDISQHLTYTTGSFSAGTGVAELARRTVNTSAAGVRSAEAAAVSDSASSAAAHAFVGAMAMPSGFRYEAVHLKGRPRHEKYSEFWCRHIPMDCTHRAKLFVAFDALKGFDEAIEDVRRKQAEETL